MHSNGLDGPAVLDRWEPCKAGDDLAQKAEEKVK